MNLVTAGNSVKHSKYTSKGYHNNTVHKERLNKQKIMQKMYVHVFAHLYEVNVTVRVYFADVLSK